MCCSRSRSPASSPRMSAAFSQHDIHRQTENSLMEMKAEFAFEARVTVGEPISLGRTQPGERRIVPITGGSFAGPRLSGSVLPGGGDWQVIRTDGVIEV